MPTSSCWNVEGAGRHNRPRTGHRGAVSPRGFALCILIVAIALATTLGSDARKLPSLKNYACSSTVMLGLGPGSPTLSLIPGCFEPHLADDAPPPAHRLLVIPAVGPASRFQCDSGRCDGAPVAQALTSLQRVAPIVAERLGVRPVTGVINARVAALPPGVMGRTEGVWDGPPDNKASRLQSVTITFSDALVQSPADFDLVAAHEYVHALEDSLGLVRLPNDLQEGLAYWVQYTMVITDDTRVTDAWRQYVVPRWKDLRADVIAGLASGASGADSERSTDLSAALVSGALVGSLGGQRYLRMLVTARSDGLTLDAVLRRNEARTFDSFVADAVWALGEPDGGLDHFNRLARGWGPL